MRYCLPLICRSTAGIDAALQQHHGAFDFFEIWLDYLQDVPPTWLESLAARWGQRLIIVTRRLELEPIQMPFRHRMTLLGMLSESRVKIDFDVGTQREDLAFWKSCGTMERVLLSFHDYQQTPSDDDLGELFAYMARQRPWMCKSATFCQRPEDAIRLQQWILSFPKRHAHQSYVILGMGEHGLPTRIFGPLWGNTMTFAPADADAISAPGQLTRSQYDTLYQMLGV